ncbi:MAG: PocR ligand-binding domain-containing protein, partial [Nitrospirota bacterium]
MNRNISISSDVTDHELSGRVEYEREQSTKPEAEAVLSAEGGPEELELADLIDIQAIQSLMDDFYKLAHIPMSIIDLKGRVMVGVGWQDICTKFHRVHPESCRNCTESDLKLSAGVSPGDFRLYKCKNNMWDAATPVVVGGRHVANVFTGQFFFDDEPLDYALFRSQARQFGYNEDEYIAALERVPRLSREAVDTGMAFFVKFIKRTLSEAEERRERRKAGDLEHKRVERLLLNQAALLELTKLRIDDMETFFKMVILISSQVLGVERGSIWLVDKDRKGISCASIYYLSSHTFEKGARLDIQRCRRYFQALEEDRILSAEDAVNDPRTNEWCENYLRPLGIVSLTDVPIRSHGEVIGILSLEHTEPRTWPPEDQEFAASVAGIVSSALAAEERRKAEKEIEKRVKDLENFYQMAVDRELKMVRL